MDKTLQDFKDEVANELGYRSYRDMCSIDHCITKELIPIESLRDIAAERYASYKVEQACIKQKGDGWILASERLPGMIENFNYSENVLVWCDGELKVMCYTLMPDDEGKWANAWCNCYGDINGDGEWDDDYEVTHWMPLPSAPKTLEDGNNSSPAKEAGE